MLLRLIAVFSLGATLGYTAHRPAEPAPLAVAAQASGAPQMQPAHSAASAARSPVLPAPSADSESANAPETPPVDAGVEPDADPFAPNGVLEGRITDSSTGEPVGWVIVTAESVLGDSLYTHTNRTGRFRFDSLRSAVYKLRFSKYGRVVVERDEGVNQLDPTECDVSFDASEPSE